MKDKLIHLRIWLEAVFSTVWLICKYGIKGAEKRTDEMLMEERMKERALKTLMSKRNLQ